jgi:transcriptional regulator with XRE-family HTH domain
MNTRLKELRKIRALSLTDLSQLSKVSRATINLIENGKQNAQPRTIRALARALKVDVEELTSNQSRMM